MTTFTHDGEEMTLVKQQDSPGFTKYRLREDDVTVDVSLVDVDADAVEEYVDDRIGSMTDMEMGIPSPYTPEVDERERDEEYPLVFQEDDGQRYGVGYADPEYRVMMEGMQQLPRYRYLVLWRYLDDRGQLAEIEVYVPKDDFEEQQALSFTREIHVHEGE